MIQKSDGGFNYDTTDLAAIEYRVKEKGANALIYITDAGQEMHFKLVFEGAKLAGFYDPEKVNVRHLGFGLVLNEKGEKIKTRAGESIKMKELLDEAKERAMKVYEERLKEEGKPWRAQYCV